MQEMAIKEAQVASAEETVVTRLIVEVCTHHIYIYIYIFFLIYKAPLYIYTRETAIYYRSLPVAEVSPSPPQDAEATLPVRALAKREVNNCTG